MSALGALGDLGDLGVFRPFYCCWMLGGEVDKVGKGLVNGCRDKKLLALRP